jgi:hypothetical protein
LKTRLLGVALAFVLIVAGGSRVQGASVAPAPQPSTHMHSEGGFVGDLQGDWSPEAHAAWDMVLKSLNTHLQITVPVAVKVSLEPLPPETLGRGGSSGSQVNFAGAPMPDLWYPNSLAAQFAGHRFSEGPDIEVTLNSTITWDYSGDPQKALKSGNPDFVTTITHEIIHGMGFLGTADAAGPEGKWGDDDGVLPPENLLHQRKGNGFVCVVSSAPTTASAARLGPATPQSSTTVSFADVWDHFVVNGAGASILDTDLWANPSSELHELLTSDDLFWNGSGGVGANNGTPLKLFAPKVWSVGSSFMHLDDATYDGGSDAFLTSAGSNIPNIEIGPRVLGMLGDMGWTVSH